MVAVAEFPSGQLRGPLFGARFSQVRQSRSRGAGTATVTVPLTAQARRVLGEPTGELDAAGRPRVTYDPLRWEFLIGSTAEGVTDRYIVRGRVSVKQGLLTAELLSIEGWPASDRVVGAATRRNLIASVGSFENGLAGWRKVGGLEATVVRGGPSGKYFVRITGDPEKAYLAATARWSQIRRPWGRQRVGAEAYVRVPAGDWADYELISVGVSAGDQQWWPDPRVVDEGAALFQDDWARNQWLTDKVSAYGYLPTTPYDATVEIRLHPVSETQHVDFDAASIILRENTSTVNEVDLTRHVGQLWKHFQFGRDKSSAGVSIAYGDPVGISEVGTWWHEDLTSGSEALEGVCGRDPGPDYWFEGPARRIRVGRRRGAKRTDLMIHTWDVLGAAGWDIDPGAQRTAVITTSSAGSLWGGANTGAIDTSNSHGQVIEVVMPGPAGMNPNRLDAWTRSQLRRLKLHPETTSLLLRYELARRIAIGDSIRIAYEYEGSVLQGWFKATRWAKESDHRYVTVDFGTDPDLGAG